MPKDFTSAVDAGAAGRGYSNDDSKANASPMSADGDATKPSAGLSDDEKNYRDALDSRLLQLERDQKQILVAITQALAAQGDAAEVEEALPGPATKSLLDLLPEGAEDLRASFAAIDQELQTLRQRDAQREQSLKQDTGKTFQQSLEIFKAMTPDWKDNGPLDAAMSKFCKDFNYYPESLGDLVKLAAHVREGAKVSILERELEAAKKAGPVPSMSSPTPSLASRLRPKRNGQAPDLKDLVTTAMRRAEEKIGQPPA